MAGCQDSGGALTVMMIVAGLWHGEAESHKGDARAISSAAKPAAANTETLGGVLTGVVSMKVVVTTPGGVVTTPPPNHTPP